MRDLSHVSVPPLGVLTLARGMSVTTLIQGLTLIVTVKANCTTAGTVRVVGANLRPRIATVEGTEL